MSEDIKKTTDGNDTENGNNGKGTDGYEKICYLCHRPESKVEKMITIPNNITICSDCRACRSFRGWKS